MYSMILLAAMSTAPEAPAFGGSWYNTCTLDMCFPMRYGWKSYGCVLHTPIHVPYGCCGGCYGHCHGCYGGFHHGACYGSGCYGYGVGYWHDPLSYGAGYSGFSGVGNYGAFGTYSLYPSGAATLVPTNGAIIANPPVSGYSLTPSATVPSTVPASTPPASSSPFDPVIPRKDVRLAPARELTTAEIVLDVPENATVFIDGNKMKSAAGRRVFTTPPIEKGESYFYTVRVVVDESGKQVEDTQKVTVRGGEQTGASFAHLKKSNAPTLVGR